MQDITLKNRFLMAYYTIRNFKKNIQAYCNHAKENARNEVLNRQWARKYHTGIDVPAKLEGPCQTNEENELYLPSHAEMTVQGDGISILLENHSRFGKHIYFSIKTESETNGFYTAPPLFDEGEPHE